MSDTVVGKIVTAILIISAVLILAFTDYGSQSKVYDCALAEWHPDIPVKIKEECRRLRQEEWRQKQDIEKKSINT
jgi:hypothetical protein